MSPPRPGELPLVGGALALDFCNTVAWRTSPQPADRLVDYGGWLEWCAHVSCISPELERHLVHAATRYRVEAADAYARVAALRTHLGAIFDALVDDVPPDRAHVDGFRAAYAASVAVARVRIEPSKAILEWPAEDDFDRPVWPVLHSVWSFLMAPKLPRIHRCEGVGCGWLFVDRTRNASRRWCSSDDCGRRERVRRHRAHHAAGSTTTSAATGGRRRRR